MNNHHCSAPNCNKSYGKSKELARHVRTEKVKEASLEENLRYHSHLVVRPRGRIPRQLQANVPEVDTVNHIQLERNGNSDSLTLPATIHITNQNNDNEEQLLGQGQSEVEVNDDEQYDDFGGYDEPNVVNNPYQHPQPPIIPLITQEDLEILQQRLDLLVQQIQTISAERDDATALVQHAQNELTNLRTIFDEVLAEKNALLIEQGCLMESNSHKQTQLDKLQTQLNNAITIQKEAAKSYQDLSDSTASIQKLNSQVENAKRNEIAKLLSDLAQAKEETAVKNSDLQRTQAEFDASRARILDLEAQLDPLQERVKELQELTDGIPNIQHSLECARSEAKQLPVLQEQVKQSTAHDLKALAPNT